MEDFVVTAKNVTTGQFFWSDIIQADSIVDALKSALESAEEAEKTKRFKKAKGARTWLLISQMTAGED